MRLGADIAREAALQGFGFQRELRGDRFGQEEYMAELEAQLGSRAAAEAFVRQKELMGEEFGYQMQGKEFDAATQVKRDLLTAGLTEDRDKRLFVQQTERDEQLHLYDVQDALREHGWDIEEGETGHQRTLEILSLEQKFAKDAALESRRWEMRGAIMDQQFTVDYADYLRTQSQIDQQLKFLPPEAYGKATALRNRLSTIWTDRRFTEGQKLDIATQAQRELMNIYRGAQDVPLEEREKTREEKLQAAFGPAYESVSHLPWSFNADGEPQLPRGYTPPQEADPQERDKANAEAWDAELERYDTALKQYNTMREMQAKFIDSHTKESDGDGETKYFDANGNEVTRHGVYREAARLFPAEMPTPPNAYQAVTPTWNPLPPNAWTIPGAQEFGQGAAPMPPGAVPPLPAPKGPATTVGPPTPPGYTPPAPYQVPFTAGEGLEQKMQSNDAAAAIGEQVTPVVTSDEEVEQLPMGSFFRRDGKLYQKRPKKKDKDPVWGPDDYGMHL
jgi:hypothetical protein